MTTDTEAIAACGARIAELVEERDKWEWVARDIAGAFPRAAAILVDAVARWQSREVDE